MSRRVDPLRQIAPMGVKRAKIVARCDQIADSVAELDRQLDELSARRRELVGELRAHRRRLWPNLARRARRPAPDGTEQLPPVAHDATFLWGRRLRAACLALLARNGALPLTEIHALLHRRNLAVAGSHPVKALADALGHENDHGRVRRVSRGVYAPTADTIERWTQPRRRIWPNGPTTTQLA